MPFSLKDAPALIERLLPVQKLSAEAYKEQMANQGKTLNALGSYWKGRKPLIITKACILACLLPATDDAPRDLQIFEKLMAMDDESFAVRWKHRPKPKEILAKLSISRITDYFTLDPAGILPTSSPVDWSDFDYKNVKVTWRDDLSELDRRRIEAQMLPSEAYRDWVDKAHRPEEVIDTVHDHIWSQVNAYLGTNAQSFPELVEQLGLMRFGRRPQVADTFCGSGQIPFEAARLGCNVYASDLNPVACMLTWGAFNIVGGSPKKREKLRKQQQELVENVQQQIDLLGVETDSRGWLPKAYLYCLEVRCPQSGFMVPLIPSLILSKGRTAVFELVPDPTNRRYQFQIRIGVSDALMHEAQTGTIGREGKYGEAYLKHSIDGVIYKTKISTLRGDYQKADGTIENRLRLWGKNDFRPRADDLFQERLYAIQWMRPKNEGKTYEYEFRTATAEDMEREHIADEFIAQNLVEWQAHGWVPDMKIEIGGPPRYQGLDLIRARGWTHWHHLFNPRQLLLNGLIVRFAETSALRLGICQAINFNSKLSRWHNGPGVDAVIDTFYNQALNTVYNHGTRSSRYIKNQIATEYKTFPLTHVRTNIACLDVSRFDEPSDILLTDPPYGDAVKYEEILDFFIAWLRKNPPPEFADWVWDSRRSLAIQGEGEDFRRRMVAGYKRMTECMPDNGIQVGGGRWTLRVGQPGDGISSETVVVHGRPQAAMANG